MSELAIYKNDTKKMLYGHRAFRSVVSEFQLPEDKENAQSAHLEL